MNPSRSGETRATVPTCLSSEWRVHGLRTQTAHGLLRTECCRQGRVAASAVIQDMEINIKGTADNSGGAASYCS